MSPLLLAASASFVAGMCATVLWRFWAQPLLRYRRLKTRVDMLVRAAAASPPAAVNGAPLAHELTTLYHGDLPLWYRELLRKRGENPLEAATHLAALDDRIPAAHRGRRIAAIATALGLGGAP